MSKDEGNGEFVYRKHDNTSKEGGLVINDQDASNSKVIYEIMKTISKKILKFELMDMLKFSRPAKITSPITVLSCCGNEYVSTSLLDQAYEATDPIERMKYISAFIMSGIHAGPEICRSKAPFNPILGETYQAVNSAGAKLYLEQTIHHPPTFNFDIVGPNKNYEVMGFGAINAQMSGMNAIKGWREGKNIIKFKDGTNIEFNNLPTLINGIMYGERTYNYTGRLTITDHTHNIKCNITLQDEPSSNILKGLFSKKKKHQYDEFSIEINQLNPTTNEWEIKAKGFGSWLGQIVYDTKVYWSIMDKKDEWKQDNLFLLPSDSSYRTDLLALQGNSIHTAQSEKERLENIQRNDHKLRTLHALKHKA